MTVMFKSDKIIIAITAYCTNLILFEKIARSFLHFLRVISESTRKGFRKGVCQWTTVQVATAVSVTMVTTKKPKDKGKGSFKTWLYTIGRNVAIDYLRKQSKHIEVSIDENNADLISDEDVVESAYIKKEQKIIVHKAMRKLAPAYQQVLWLIYFEELSNKEAAKVMRKSVRSIESLLYRARKSLKSQLEMEGYDYEKL